MSKSSWGNYPKASKQDTHFIQWINQSVPSQDSLLPYGLGRSYGDSCLNDQGTLLITQNLNRFIDFDSSSGVVTAEAGVTLEDILLHFVPQGWFLPVTPGTKFVTLGGAIANDVHGKNHHSVGNFGHHVLEFTLLRSNQKLFTCSPDQNSDLFYATIGGLGLTGLILSVKMKLKKIQSSYIKQDIIVFDHLQDFYQLSQESAQNYEFSVAWIDCFENSKKQNRGIFFRGNFSDNQELPTHSQKSLVKVPFFLPSQTLNALTVKSFNELYFQAHRLKSNHNILTSYNSFFYPLDSIHQWNKIYGINGFYQYQCVVPLNNKEAMQDIFTMIAKYQQGSFLAVLKVFGNIKSLGLMSFPMEGVTLALDFPVNTKSTELLDNLDEIVMEAKGKVYIAKDARMSKKAFYSYYPQIEEFLKYKDPNFTSSFLRRVL